MFQANKDGMSDVTDVDRSVTSLLPGTNFARLVMTTGATSQLGESQTKTATL